MSDQGNASVNGRAAAAIEAARFGLRVFPVAPRGKKPLLRGWQSSATSDPDVVEAIWASRPEANIGVACGGGLIVVDTDTPAGEEAVRELCVAKTATVTTGRGRHFYLRGESRNRTDLLPGVDVRGAGGYVVGPGSLHTSGTEYRWELPPWKVEPAPLPPALLALLAEKQKRRNASPLPAAIERGMRNSTLFRLACGLRGISGLGFEECFAAVAWANKLRCKPPLDEDEVERIARAAATSYDAAPLWATDPIAFAEDPTLGSKERHLLVALAASCEAIPAWLHTESPRDPADRHARRAHHRQNRRTNERDGSKQPLGAGPRWSRGATARSGRPTECHRGVAPCGRRNGRTCAWRNTRLRLRPRSRARRQKDRQRSSRATPVRPQPSPRGVDLSLR